MAKYLASFSPFSKDRKEISSGVSAAASSPAGGQLSYYSAGQRNAMPIPAGRSVIKVSLNFGLMEPTASSPRVAFINEMQTAAPFLTSVTIVHTPILRLRNVGQQSMRISPSQDLNLIIKYVHVLHDDVGGQWMVVGEDMVAREYSQGSHLSVVPLTNTNPSCPTATVRYDAKLLIPTPSADQNPELSPWLQALGEIKAGIRPQDTVGIAISACYIPVEVITQNPIPSTDFSLSGVITFDSPHFVGYRGFGGTPFPEIAVVSTTPYDSTNTVVF